MIAAARIRWGFQEKKAPDFESGTFETRQTNQTLREWLRISIMSTLESQLQTALLLAAPAILPDLRFFRRNIGAASMGGVTVRFAIKGQCDLYGYIRGGRMIEVELKALGKRIKPGSDQEKWQTWCRSWGVPHIVLRPSKDETTTQTVERWCEELRLLISGTP